VKNVAGSGARWVDVSAQRFPGWIEGFAARHGDPVAVAPAVDGVVSFSAPDGAVAECHPPYGESFVLAPGDTGLSAAGAAKAIAAHAAMSRTVGVLLVRLGGYAAGIFTGYPPALGEAKVGSRPVHGRSAAGGWSQHRFARRREKQVNEALEAAANAALLIFGAPGSRKPAFDAFVLGGDKRAVAELREDPRLAPYFALATERFLTVPDPRRAVLEATPKQFAGVRIRLSSPGGTTPRTPQLSPGGTTPRTPRGPGR
jgi:Actinobacteria/chloroflexi VLRF1 release factor